MSNVHRAINAYKSESVPGWLPVVIVAQEKCIEPFLGALHTTSETIYSATHLLRRRHCNEVMLQCRTLNNQHVAYISSWEMIVLEADQKTDSIRFRTSSEQHSLNLGDIPDSQKQPGARSLLKPIKEVEITSTITGEKATLSHEVKFWQPSRGSGICRVAKRTDVSRQGDSGSVWVDTSCDQAYVVSANFVPDQNSAQISYFSLT